MLEDKILDLLLDNDVEIDCEALLRTVKNLKSLREKDDVGNDEVKSYLKDILLWVDVISSSAEYTLQEIQAIEKGVDDE